ncbi:MAG: hypothetical protein P1V51_24925 [Deltaproteobacteria bacterium]|nr:hypothetical protein [Deltaproteobacteria bacterium]
MNASSLRNSAARRWVGLRVLFLPLACAGAAAASAAYLASGGLVGSALLAGSLGLAAGAVGSTLLFLSPEHRLAARWPRLTLAGWRPPLREPLELPLELYAAGEAALGHCGAARRILGVRADTFRQQVAGLVGKGDAAYTRAREAKAWLEAADAHRGQGEEGAVEASGRLGRWVHASARAREAREAQVRRDLAGAREELASTTTMLGDLALRLSGLSGELGPEQQQRQLILPHLAALHQEMSALERAVASTPPISAPTDLEVCS